MSAHPEHTGDPVFALALSIGAGLSTTLGACLPFFVSTRNTKYLAMSLAFSAGVMIYVSFVELFKEAAESFAADKNLEARNLKPAVAPTLSFFAGILISVLFCEFAHYLDPKQPDIGDDTDNARILEDMAEEAAAADAETADLEAKGAAIVEMKSPASQRRLSLTEASDESETANATGSNMSDNSQMVEKAKSTDPADDKTMALRRLSIISALAIFFHNIPEGLATFTSGLQSTSVGFTVAIAIAVHNIPEGICIAIPVYYATGSRWKAIFWATLSGVSEPLAALILFIAMKIAGVSQLSESAYGVMFGLVSGMMVFISMAELLPTAYKYDPENKYATRSLTVGMMVMAASLVMFEYI